MAFGIPASLNSSSLAMISHTQSGAANTADMMDASGVILDQHTYGATITISTDYYLKSGDTWTNGAVNGQSGNTVITASALNSTNTGYQHVTETTRSINITGSTT